MTSKLILIIRIIPVILRNMIITYLTLGLLYLLIAQKLGLEHIINTRDVLMKQKLLLRHRQNARKQRLNSSKGLGLPLLSRVKEMGLNKMRSINTALREKNMQLQVNTDLMKLKDKKTGLARFVLHMCL